MKLGRIEFDSQACQEFENSTLLPHFSVGSTRFFTSTLRHHLKLCKCYLRNAQARAPQKSLDEIKSKSGDINISHNSGSEDEIAIFVLAEVLDVLEARCNLKICSLHASVIFNHNHYSPNLPRSLGTPTRFSWMAETTSCNTDAVCSCTQKKGALISGQCHFWTRGSSQWNGTRWRRYQKSGPAGTSFRSERSSTRYSDELSKNQAQVSSRVSRWCLLSLYIAAIILRIGVDRVKRQVYFKVHKLAGSRHLAA